VTHLSPPLPERTSPIEVPKPTPGATEAEAFVREHQAGIWRYLRLLGAGAADADDLLQETFLRFLRSSTAHMAPAAMLRRIARGLWVDRHRWLRRRAAVQWAEEVDAAVAATPADDDQELWLDALRRCRTKLGERAQRALELAYRDGLGREEVARALDLAPNTVRNLLASARQSLRQCIENRIRDDEGENR
jgi:RNA polymerase sigma-70 factor (ECF subfamily)